MAGPPDHLPPHRRVELGTRKLRRDGRLLRAHGATSRLKPVGQLRGTRLVPSKPTNTKRVINLGKSGPGGGGLGVRKVVDVERTETIVPVGTEHAEFERYLVAEADSGEVEVLEDGCKHTVTEERLVEADLRRERVEVDVDPEVADRVTHEHVRSGGSVTGEDAGAPATTIQGGAA